MYKFTYYSHFLTTHINKYVDITFEIMEGNRNCIIILSCTF